MGPYILRSFERDESYEINHGTVVGRELDCAVCLSYSKVSRYHAKFSILHQALYVEDLQSSNGTYVNGKRIALRVPVVVGDEVTFGNIRYRMTSEQAGSSEATQLFNPTRVGFQALAGDAQADENLNPLASFSTIGLRAHQPIQPRQPSEIAGLSSTNPDHSAANNYHALVDQAPSSHFSPKPLSAELAIQVPAAEGEQTRLYSPSSIQSIAQRNLDHHADLLTGSGPRFVLLTAPLRGKICHIGVPEAGSSLTIGRDKACDICIAETSISRHHASITYSGLQFHIDAVNASNAFLINGEAQESRAILRHGDKIQFGRMDTLFLTDVKQDVPALPQQTSGIASHYKWLILGLAVVSIGMVASTLYLRT
jgi:pSer/pThr/pTyr-binding forkhead associated (FHA) protein